MGVPSFVPGQKESLPAQIRLAHLRAQGYRVAFGDTTTNEEAAEENLRQLYQVAGFSLPPIEWVDSPLAAVRLRHFRGATRQSFADRWLHGLLDRGREIPSESENPVLETFGSLVHESNQTLHRLGCGEVWSEVAQALFAFIPAWSLDPVALLRQTWAQEHHGFHLGWDPRFGSYLNPDDIRILERHYSYFRNISLLAFFCETFPEAKLPVEKITPFFRLTTTTGGCFLHREYAILVRKPTIFAYDERQRFHSATGPALAYRDGQEAYAWHGTLVPSQVIRSPEELSILFWHCAPSVDVQRAIQERMPNFVDRASGVCIDHGQRGDLYEVNLPLRDPERIARYVRVVDPSTGQRYDLRVPPGTTSADQAVAWTFGLAHEDYQPVQEA